MCERPSLSATVGAVTLPWLWVRQLKSTVEALIVVLVHLFDDLEDCDQHLPGEQTSFPAVSIPLHVRLLPPDFRSSQDDWFVCPSWSNHSWHLVQAWPVQKQTTDKMQKHTTNVGTPFVGLHCKLRVTSKQHLHQLKHWPGVKEASPGLILVKRMFKQKYRCCAVYS